MKNIQLKNLIRIANKQKYPRFEVVCMATWVVLELSTLL